MTNEDRGHASTKVPKGRQSIATGVSPWGKRPPRVSPEGAEDDPVADLRPVTCPTDATVAMVERSGVAADSIRWAGSVPVPNLVNDRTEGDAPRARLGQCMDRTRFPHPRRDDGALSPGHDRRHDPARALGRFAGGDMPRGPGALGEPEDRPPRSRTRLPTTPGQGRHHHGHHRRRPRLPADYLLAKARRRLRRV